MKKIIKHFFIATFLFEIGVSAGAFVPERLLFISQLLSIY